MFIHFSPPLKFRRKKSPSNNRQNLLKCVGAFEWRGEFIDAIPATFWIFIDGNGYIIYIHVWYNVSIFALKITLRMCFCSVFCSKSLILWLNRVLLSFNKIALIACPSLHPKSHYACVFAEVCRLGSLILCLNRVLLSFNKIALIACWVNSLFTFMNWYWFVFLMIQAQHCRRYIAWED